MARKSAKVEAVEPIEPVEAPTQALLPNIANGKAAGDCLLAHGVTEIPAEGTPEYARVIDILKCHGFIS